MQTHDYITEVLAQVKAVLPEPSPLQEIMARLMDVVRDIRPPSSPLQEIMARLMDVVRDIGPPPISPLAAQIVAHQLAESEQLGRSLDALNRARMQERESEPEPEQEPDQHRPFGFAQWTNPSS